jgi:hypothetical protein
LIDVNNSPYRELIWSNSCKTNISITNIDYWTKIKDRRHPDEIGLYRLLFTEPPWLEKVPLASFIIFSNFFFYSATSLDHSKNRTTASSWRIIINDFNGDDVLVWKTAREVATPTTIDGEMAALDSDGSSAGWHVIDHEQTKLK